MATRMFKTVLIVLLPIALLTAQSSSRELQVGVRMPQTINQLVIAAKIPALEQPIDPASYLVGPGDVFVISINDVEPYLGLVAVTPTGEMVIPAVGGVAVDGMTLAAARLAILERIREMYPSQEADCALYDLRKNRVAIAGAIHKAGYYLATPVSRVSDLITMAGEPLLSASMNNVVIEQLDGERQTYDLTRFYYEGDISQNPMLHGGDRVIIPFGTYGTNGWTGMRRVIVMGEVKRPGSFIFQPGLKVMDYVALAGGPSTYSSLKDIWVLRADREMSSDPLSEVLPGDILDVRRSLKYKLVGNTGLLQAVLVALNMYLAFLATQR